MKRKVTLGTVSHATMRPEDLIPTFMQELKWYRVRRPAGVATRMRKKGYYESEEAGCDLEELFDALDAIAPAHCYFGASEGDGSDYGFWLSFDQEDFDGLQVSDLSEVPKGYTGEVLEVSDHGNMTLYNAVRGRLYEVWSVV